MFLHKDLAAGNPHVPDVRAYKLVRCDRLPFWRERRAIESISPLLPADLEDRPSVLAKLCAMNSLDRVYVSISAAELHRCDRDLKSTLPVAKFQLLNSTESDLASAATLIYLLREEPDHGTHVRRLLGPRTVSIEDQPAGVPCPVLTISGELRTCGGTGGAGWPWQFDDALLRSLLRPIRRVLLLPPSRRDDVDGRRFVFGEDAAWIVSQVATHGAWQRHLAEIQPCIRVIRAAMLPRAWAGGRGSRKDD